MKENSMEDYMSKFGNASIVDRGAKHTVFWNPTEGQSLLRMEDGTYSLRSVEYVHVSDAEAASWLKKNSYQLPNELKGCE